MKTMDLDLKWIGDSKKGSEKLIMKNDMFDLPDSLYDFAQIPNFCNVIEQLSGIAEPEDWTYHNWENDHKTKFPILENYINNTYRRLATEKKIAFSNDKKSACFDTGLISRTQNEPIYMLFYENTNPNVECYWHFAKFFKKGEIEVKKFQKLPEMAFYWEDPVKLIYDTRKELVVNSEHIINDNRERFPSPYDVMPDYNLKLYIDGCIKAAIEKVKRNYKIAVPQYFLTSGTIQLLIPLCLSTPEVADLAIVVEDYGTMYRASTCLTLDMAINNARLLARPDRDWLNP